MNYNIRKDIVLEMCKITVYSLFSAEVMPYKNYTHFENVSTVARRFGMFTVKMLSCLPEARQVISEARLRLL